MTRFEYIAADVRRVATLLEIAQSDGLVAKGCSVKLQMPPTETQNWVDWLSEDYPAEWDEWDRSGELGAMERAVNESAMATLND